ncbi:hypothetical protein [Aureimonas sp. AU20]|uniref:hypothetical protein n=1 Tax=Aureimonas sp. AU20 TaxID=1349819 RepID=UPI0011DF2546|nr:hypothetical protein [Aureimonas sp. AU20]
MLLRIIDGAEGPGLVSLDTLRQISAAVEQDLADRLHALEIGAISQSKLDAETQARVAALQALSKALTDEVSARTTSVSGEVTARANADTAEATARANADTAEATARAQAISALAARVKALEDKPALKFMRFSELTNANGIATITFKQPFASLLDIEVLDTWSGEQLVAGGILTSSVTGCTVQAMISRGTLLLTAGPFTKAGANVSVTVRAIGT